jgi:hypothetical protein
VISQRSLVTLVAAAWCAAATAGEPAAPAVSSGLVTRLSARGDRIEVAGASPQLLATLHEQEFDAAAWQRVLAVFVAGQDQSAPVPLLGRYEVDGSLVVFTPRFPLRPGLKYRVAFNPTALAGGVATPADRVDAVVGLPAAPAGKPTVVDAVYPSGDQLPENLLKFYIRFSAPMTRGEAYRRVHIVDAADGREVPDAFLEIGEELWDARTRRLTVFFDPGRVKRGLRPNKEVGAPLVAGRNYALVIDAGWRDARGGSLSEAFRKEFSVVAPDHQQPRPSRWRLTAAAAGGTDPLTVEFDEPLDHALTRRLLTIRDADGQELAGRVQVDNGEQRWRFQPNEPWQAGRYTLVIGAALEDRAGNSVGRAFEVKNPTAEADAAAHQPVSLPFEVRAP